MATITWEWFSKALANEQGGEIAGDAFAFDFLSDDIKVALLADAASPNKDTWETLADITNQLPTAGGYTAGGVSLAAKTLSVVAANSWATQRANSTAYAVGDIVRPATGNGFLYRCVVAGTSGGSIPTYSTTIGRETADGTVVWSTLGAAAVVWDADDPTWPGATFACRYAVAYKNTGVAATSPLMLLGTMSAEVSVSGGPFVIQLTNGLAVKARA